MIGQETRIQGKILTSTGDTMARGRPQPGPLVPRAHALRGALGGAEICTPGKAILTLCICMEVAI